MLCVYERGWGEVVVGMNLTWDIFFSNESSHLHPFFIVLYRVIGQKRMDCMYTM